MFRLSLLRILIAVLALAAAPRAFAAPTEADRQQARALAAEGFAALQAKDYATAEERFRRADKLIHAPTLVVDWARSLVGLGRLVEAHERYEQVIREGVSDNAPWQWKRALKDAEREIQSVKPRLAWVTVTVSGPDQPTVFIDGRRVPPAAIGVPRAVNPGRRMVAAWARGYSSKQQPIDLSEGQHLSLDLTLEPKPEGAPEEPEPVIAEVVDELPPPRYEPVSNARRTIGYVAVTAGGVGLVVGTVSAFLALNARSDLSGKCAGGTCVPLTQSQRGEYEQDIERYDLFRTASTIGFAVGVVGVATGAYFLLSGGSRTQTVGNRRPQLVPVVGWRSLAVLGSF